ncbi:nitrogen regulation protein NR(II) [uncultured Oxalobacter sp.]|uniref:nitrogen regulation protein NR(II) n=1 Tax=uncultured Oxalobacter sp. TaxID=337245 RepID=UPI002595D31A|nr:nitrogen regulation protein NR(II) [uncultured Oxalobacter sp.]
MMDSVSGLDLLASAILILDRDGIIVYVNPAAEDLFESSSKVLLSQHLKQVFPNSDVLEPLCEQVVSHDRVEVRQELVLERVGRPALHVHCIVKPVDLPEASVLIELRENIAQIRQERENRLVDQTQANRELVRNLAHEIKNPLGGIRGAAQLLEMELPGRELKDLREYTQVIVRETERLQKLVDRLLVPHRRPHIETGINIHEVCERVRSLILAEHPKGLKISRDYDLSIPEITGDKEQLIQAVLNIAQNAANVLTDRIRQEDAELIFKTRVSRQVTLARVRYRLALNLHIIDNGPGIPADLIEKIFNPLVSGTEGGSGLGLTLSQTLIQQHGGIIECESVPGHTEFLIRLPLVRA